MQKGIVLPYESIKLKTEITIDYIISVHYFEYMNDFSFEGESHDFWELLCVDKGTVEIVADSNTYTLNKGDIIFHQPNEFHNVNSNGIVAPNLVVIGFECDSPGMSFFKNKILQVDRTEQIILAEIIKEAKGAFAGRLDDTYLTKLPRNKKQPYGSEQLIKMYLEMIMITLVRTYSNLKTKQVLPNSSTHNRNEYLFNQIVIYMEDNLGTQLTIDKICEDNLISRSILQMLFRNYGNSGVIDYYSNLKINTAKQLIRNQQLNITQIADALGYTSIHYFTRQFKKISGMTPTEYASSIKSMAEK